jgi:hypothetical protein
MVTVFKVSKEGFQDTRLHLACTPWGEAVRSNLVLMGFTVQPTDEWQHPDNRGPEELKRRDYLLDLTSPY